MLAHRLPAGDRRYASSHVDTSDYRQRLRAHSKRAWNMFNGMIAVGELDRYYGPLLAAHVYLTRGRSSHTASQREVARQANLPLDRVKDQMRRLEALGMLSHQREGNRWRSTLLPFVSRREATAMLARARAWSEDQASTYLADLAERGVRLPWLPEASRVQGDDSGSTAASDPGISPVAVERCHSEPCSDRVSALLQAAQRALAEDDLKQTLVQITAAAQELLAASTVMQGALHTPLDAQKADNHVSSEPPSNNPRNDPERHPVSHPAVTSHSNPRTSHSTALQRNKRMTLIKDRNPNHNPKSPNPPQPPARTHAARGEDGEKLTIGDDSECCVVTNEAVRCLVAEGVYPRNVRRFADLPGEIIRAAVGSTGLPPGHVHRAGRLVERLEAYRDGLWQPPPTCETTQQPVQPPGMANELLSLKTQAPLLPDGTEIARPGEQSIGTVDDRDTVWSALLSDVVAEISAAEFDTWLRPTQLVHIDDDTAIVAAGNVFAKEHLAATYTDLVVRLLQRRCGRSILVDFVVA